LLVKQKANTGVSPLRFAPVEMTCCSTLTETVKKHRPSGDAGPVLLSAVLILIDGAKLSCQLLELYFYAYLIINKWFDGG
jgi:hypothetical protein